MKQGYHVHNLRCTDPLQTCRCSLTDISSDLACMQLHCQLHFSTVGLSCILRNGPCLSHSIRLLLSVPPAPAGRRFAGRLLCFSLPAARTSLLPRQSSRSRIGPQCSFDIACRPHTVPCRHAGNLETEQMMLRGCRPSDQQQLQTSCRAPRLPKSAAFLLSAWTSCRYFGMV